MKLESQQLTPFGKRTRERLEKLGKDEAWLLKQLRNKEIFLTEERYLQVITGEVRGRPHEIAIANVLHDEEHIQKLAKKIGIKRGWKRLPYKKPDKPFIGMYRLLKGYDLNAQALARVLGCSVPTAREKLENPSRLTLDNLSKIHRYGHIDWETIQSAVKE